MSDTVKAESTIKNGRRKESEKTAKKFLTLFLFLLLDDLQRKVRKWVTRRTTEEPGANGCELFVFLSFSNLYFHIFLSISAENA